MSASLRVLQTLDAVGGVWRYAMDLSRALRAHGVETVFLGFGPPPSPRQRAEAEATGTLDWADAPLDWLASGPADLAAVPDLLGRAARRHGADLLHLNLPSQAAGLATERPVLVVSHSCVTTWFRAAKGMALPPGWEWQGDLNARGLGAADLVVAPSRAHADALLACYGPLPDLRIVPNASDAPETRLPERPFALASGRWWDEGKDGATLDDAAALTDWPVRLLGPAQGPNGTAFAPRHARLDGELPHADAVAQMREAGVFVSPSLYEPFGLAVLEAARMGLPLVLSDIPTFRELWDGCALFFAPRDADALASAVNRLAADPTLRLRLGQAAQVRSRRFTTKAQAARMLALYETLAGATLPAAAAR
jgi:glycosyltransferase involved in cell wall biosynthesis